MNSSSPHLPESSGSDDTLAELIADYDAGVLDPAESARVRSLIDADPAARRILSALRKTRAELSSLKVEDAPMPPDVVDRIARVVDSIDAP
ncbi:MAG: hypothetical protein QM658_04375 [Gordonia sp. (in: high G+C Gram-positive bacteria)]